MSTIAVTRDQHADRLVNIAVDQYGERLKLIRLNVPADDPGERIRLFDWAWSEAVRNVRDAEDFRLERCRQCHGEARVVTSVESRFPDEDHVTWGPCRSCLGSGKHR